MGAPITMKIFCALAVLALAACDSDGVGEVEVGRQLRVTEYAAVQPASRAAYAGFAMFDAGREMCAVRPGAVSGELPTLIRCIQSPVEIRNEVSQIDQDGYLWMATPDYGDGGPQRQVLIADPSTGRVVRVITVPSELRGVGDLIIGPDRVYLRSWRDGFSGAVGVVDRRCAQDETACDARVFTDLGQAGLSSNKAFHLTDQYLYSFSNKSSAPEGRGAIDQIDLQTGDIVRSRDLAESGFSVGDVAAYGGDFFLGREGLTRLDAETLETAVQKPGPDGYLVAAWGGLVYRASVSSAEIEVRSAETLDVVSQINIAATGLTDNAFGFVSPGVLMLNQESFLNVLTGEIAANHFPKVTVSVGGSALRLGAGVTLDD